MQMVFQGEDDQGRVSEWAEGDCLKGQQQPGDDY